MPEEPNIEAPPINEPIAPSKPQPKENKKQIKQWLKESWEAAKENKKLLYSYSGVMVSIISFSLGILMLAMEIPYFAKIDAKGEWLSPTAIEKLKNTTIILIMLGIAFSGVGIYGLSLFSKRIKQQKDPEYTEKDEPDNPLGKC